MYVEESRTLLILDLALHIVDSIRALNLKGDGLSSKCLDEDLHNPAGNRWS